MARPDCPKCSGTGWRTVPVTGPSASREATARQAVLCDCAGDDRLERLVAAARIPRRYEKHDFENYEVDIQHDEPEGPAWNHSRAKAKFIAEAFVRNYPQVEDTGLLFMGPCGVGKTHLAIAVIRKLMERGHSALFCDYRELLKQIQASYNADRQTTEMAVLEPILTSELLLLDDLGSSKPSAWALETVGHILNTRYNEKRVTLITTNYLDSASDNEPPRDTWAEKRALRMPSGQALVQHREDSLAQRIGERIRSRLYEMCRTVEIHAPDYRKEIRQAGRMRP